MIKIIIFISLIFLMLITILTIIISLWITQVCCCYMPTLGSGNRHHGLLFGPAARVPTWIQGLGVGFKVEGVGFHDFGRLEKVVGFTVYGLGTQGDLGIRGSGFSGFRVEVLGDLGFRGLRVFSGLGFRVRGLRFRVHGVGSQGVGFRARV